MKNKLGIRNSRVSTRHTAPMNVRSSRRALRFVESRLAMTLIELMVVIVILLTLVAGVLPLVSPNNDARKIAEAARGLQTYFMQAQAEAARLGRPVGVGFKETAPGSGVAIEAFQMVVPQPFAGFDENAAVQILYPDGVYGDDELEVLFRDLYYGAEMHRLQFVKLPLILHKSEGYPMYAPDNFPDNMLRVGDVINLEGNEFLIVDGENNQINQQGYVYSERGDLTCLWLNNFGQQPPQFYTAGDPKKLGAEGNPKPGTARAYRIFRQPASTNKFGPSSEAAYQFPAGIAIDLQASGLEAGDFTLFSTLDAPRETTSGSLGLPRSIAIMFSPDGGIESVWSNGVKLTGTTRTFFMIGRQENGNPDPDLYSFYSRDQRPTGGNGGISDEELRDIRTRVNWLNLDSRWLVINGVDGRLTVNQNASFDPRDPQFDYYKKFSELRNALWQSTTTQERNNRGGPDVIEAELHRQLQIEAAHEFVHGDAGATPTDPKR